MNLIAVGSDIGADRIAWDVAERVSTATGITYRRCRSPATELPAMLTPDQPALILDALLLDEACDDIRELDVHTLSSSHPGTASHGLGVADTLHLMSALEQPLPAPLTLIGLPIDPTQDVVRPEQTERLSAQVIDWMQAPHPTHPGV